MSPCGTDALYLCVVFILLVPASRRIKLYLFTSPYRAEPREDLHDLELLLLGTDPGLDFSDEITVGELGIRQGPGLWDLLNRSLPRLEAHLESCTVERGISKVVFESSQAVGVRRLRSSHMIRNHKCKHPRSNNSVPFHILHHRFSF